MKYLLSVYFIFFKLAIWAQNTVPCNCNKELRDAYSPQLQGQIYKGLAGMVGTDFFTPEYVTGDIYLENGEVSFDQQIKYNGRIDGLVLSPPNSSKEILLEKHFIKGFCLKNYAGNSCVMFGKIKVVNELGNDSSSIYGQILYQNKLSIYSYRRYSLQNIYDEADGKQIVRKLYKPSFVYYFQLPNKKTIRFKNLKKRDLYKIFPANKEMMKKIFREKHLRRFLSEDDLIQITQILNSLYE